MKKAIDFACGLLCFVCFLGVIGAVGAFETDAITGGQCIVRAAGFLLCLLLLGIGNATLMRWYE